MLEGLAPTRTSDLPFKKTMLRPQHIVKALEKELTLEKDLAEIEKILWAKINQSITEQWWSIQAIYE